MVRAAWAVFVATVALTAFAAPTYAGELAQPGQTIVDDVMPSLSYTTTGDEWVSTDSGYTSFGGGYSFTNSMIYSPTGALMIDLRRSTGKIVRRVHPGFSRSWGIVPPKVDVSTLPPDRCAILETGDELWKMRAHGIGCTTASRALWRFLHTGRAPHGWRCTQRTYSARCWKRGQGRTHYAVAVESSQAELEAERVSRSHEVTHCGDAGAILSGYEVFTRLGDTSSCTAFSKAAGRIAAHHAIYNEPLFATDGWVCRSVSNGLRCEGPTGCALMGLGNGPRPAYAVRSDAAGWFTYILGGPPC